MGRDLKVGRQDYADGSRRFVKLPHVKKYLRAQDLRSEEPS